MFGIAVAVLAALGVWWASTGLILVLDSRPRRTFRWSMAVATGLLGLALYGIKCLRDDVTAGGAYLGFGCAIAAWGWLEMSFLLGYITGSRRQGCAAGCRGWHHFLHAIQAILYHELAIIALLLTAFALGRGGGNQVAAQSMLLLWGMRVSSKLNLFLGVRNPGTELLPPNLAYLASFFRRQPINFLFPVSVTAGTALVVLLVRALLAHPVGEFSLARHALLATLAGLGVLEHWMLVLPFSSTALWGWFREPSAPDSRRSCSRRSAA